jgi:hypothetical protein
MLTAEADLDDLKISELCMSGDIFEMKFFWADFVMFHLQ